MTACMTNTDSLVCMYAQNYSVHVILLSVAGGSLRGVGEKGDEEAVVHWLVR